MSKVHIVKNDITHMDVDCIVNSANEWLQAGSGVCGRIFREAGRSELQKSCDEIGHCDTGHAVITPGFHLRAKYVIHAVGPIYRDGNHREPILLYRAYMSSLEIVREYHIHSIAFPVISAGIYGYPKKEAWKMALQAGHDFIKKNRYYHIDIYFTAEDQSMIDLGLEVMDTIA